MIIIAYNQSLQLQALQLQLLMHQRKVPTSPPVSGCKGVSVGENVCQVHSTVQVGENEVIK